MRSFFSFFVDNQDLPKNRFSQWMSTVSRRFFFSFYQCWIPKVTTWCGITNHEILGIEFFFVIHSKEMEQSFTAARSFFYLSISTVDLFWRCKRHTQTQSRWREKTQKTSLMNISRNFNVNSLFKNILEILTGKRFSRANEVFAYIKQTEK